MTQASRIAAKKSQNEIRRADILMGPIPQDPKIDVEKNGKKKTKTSPFQSIPSLSRL